MSRARSKVFLARSACRLIVVAPALLLTASTALASGDLQVTFSTAPPATINGGGSYSFAVEVTNNAVPGPPAETVVFEYRPPRNVAVTAISSSVGSCEAGTKNEPSDPASCALGDMPSGLTETVNITVRVDESVLPGTMLDNDVRAWQFGTDDDPPDNQNHAFVQANAGCLISSSSAPASVTFTAPRQSKLIFVTVVNNAASTGDAKITTIVAPAGSIYSVRWRRHRLPRLLPRLLPPDTQHTFVVSLMSIAAGTVTPPYVRIGSKCQNPGGIN